MVLEIKKCSRALLLAAGNGLRLKPLTNTWPKCLMPIANRPLLEYWLKTLEDIGFDQVLVNTHSHSNHVAKFLARDRYSFWVKPVYEKDLLGTAATIRENADFFSGETTLVAHADNWCHCNFNNFINFHLYERPKQCLITMMTFDTKNPKECGIVETDNEGVVLAFHEKVEHAPGNKANGAVYLLHPHVIEHIKDQTDITDFSKDVLPKYLGRIATWHNNNIHRDIGTIGELRAAQQDYIPKLKWPIKDNWEKSFLASSDLEMLLKYFKINKT